MIRIDESFVKALRLLNPRTPPRPMSRAVRARFDEPYTGDKEVCAVLLGGGVATETKRRRMAALILVGTAVALADPEGPDQDEELIPPLMDAYTKLRAAGIGFPPGFTRFMAELAIGGRRTDPDVDHEAEPEAFS